MVNIILLATVIFLLVLTKRAKLKPEVQKIRRGDNGCAHISNKNLRVTALGDKQEYFLCSICNKKVKASELNN